MRKTEEEWERGNATTTDGQRHGHHPSTSTASHNNHPAAVRPYAGPPPHRKNARCERALQSSRRHHSSSDPHTPTHPTTQSSLDNLKYPSPRVKRGPSRARTHPPIHRSTPIGHAATPTHPKIVHAAHQHPRRTFIANPCPALTSTAHIHPSRDRGVSGALPLGT